MNSPAGQSSSMRRIEWAVCLAVTLAAICLHGFYLAHAGALWRDEAGIVRLATRAQPRETLQMLTHDHAPVLFPAILRAWSAAGPGQTDFGLRCLGFLIGLSLLGAIWLNARVLGFSLPLLSLALLAANATLVRWGDSLRAYGLSCALTLLALAAIWSFLRKPVVRRWLLAAFSSILSVQCLYQNACLLLAICLAGAVVCFRVRQPKTLLAVLGIGAAAAVSLLPYVGSVMASQTWFIVEKTGFMPDIIWFTLCDALGRPMIWQIPVWLLLVVLAAASGFGPGKPRSGASLEAGTLRLFASLTLSLGVLFFFAFVAISKLPTEPWYWLPLMVPVAVCIDAALAEWLDRFRVGRLVLVVLMMGIPFVPTLKALSSRQTNIDLLAAELNEKAGPDDLIVVYPWYYGVSFSRYYHGAAPWTSLPALSDLGIHRYDLVKEKLAATEPIKDVLDRIAQALAGGHRVWLVGGLPAPRPGETQPPDLPPAPNGPYGWLDYPYNYVWGRQAQYLITTHGARAAVVPLPLHGPVSGYENVPLILVEGWTQPTP